MRRIEHLAVAVSLAARLSCVGEAAAGLPSVAADAVAVAADGADRDGAAPSPDSQTPVVEQKPDVGGETKAKSEKPPDNTPEKPPDKEEPKPKAAVDIPPLAGYDLPDCATTAGGPTLLITENLAVHSDSSKHMSHGQTLTVRFVARKAVACRYFAAAGEDNIYDDELFSVGPDEPFGPFHLKDFMVIREGGQPEEIRSCGMPLDRKSKSPPQYEPADEEGKKLVCVDFRFGPYTNDFPSFELYRFDRGFTGWDLKSKVSVANHGRYHGWFEVALLTRFTKRGSQSVEVAADPGSETRRIHIGETNKDFDVALAVKWLTACTGDENGWLGPMDLQVADFCWGLNMGISALDPANRWYPVGTHFTFGFVSLDIMISVERITRVSGGYTHGLLFDGEPSEVPTRKKVEPGINFGVGIDPVIFGRLLKGLVLGEGS